MKIKLKSIVLTTLITMKVFAQDENSLQGACGYLALTSEHIAGLDSWTGSKEVSIGAYEPRPDKSNALFAYLSPGITVEKTPIDPANEPFNQLASISFDYTDERSSKNELIVERECGCKHPAP